MKKLSTKVALLGSVVLGATTLLSLPAHAATTITAVVADYDGNGATAAFWTNLSKSFTAANPDITVNVQTVNWNDINQKVATLVSTNQTPDIVNDNLFSGRAAAGLLYKDSEVLPQSVIDNIIPTFLNNSMYNGDAYAVPDLASARALFWNKDILAKAGVTSIPQTWAQLNTAMAAIKAKVPGVYPYAVPLGPEEAQAEWAIWAGGNGGQYYNSTTNKWTINSTSNVVTGLYLQNMVKNGYTEPNPDKCDRTACAQALFAAGKAAFIDGSVFFPGWLKSNGGSAINYGVGPFVHNTGHSSITLGVQDYFTFFKANNHAAEIGKFMTYFFQPDNYAAFLKATGGFIPATKDAGAKAATDPALAPFVALLPHAIFYPDRQATWGTVQGAVQQKIGGIVNGNVTSVLNAIQKTAVNAKA
jgi:multiple sugar transport system substrate-binding protein